MAFSEARLVDSRTPENAREAIYRDIRRGIVIVAKTNALNGISGYMCVGLGIVVNVGSVSVVSGVARRSAKCIHTPARLIGPMPAPFSTASITVDA